MTDEEVSWKIEADESGMQTSITFPAFFMNPKAFYELFGDEGVECVKRSYENESGLNNGE